MKKKTTPGILDINKSKSSKIILTGFMGCGKSSVGKRLADHLNIPFYDTDLIIEALESMSINEIFEMKGETYFRELEHIVAKSLHTHPSCVISTGGGLPVFHGNMKILNQTGLTVYLKVPIKTLTDRIFSDMTRPLVVNLKSKRKVYQFIRESLKIRNPFYKQSSYIVACRDKNVEEICQELVSLIFKTPMS